MASSWRMINARTKISLPRILKSFDAPICTRMLRVACWVYLSITGRVSGTRQRMGIVAYIEFNGEHEQAQSSARRMSYQTVARNYAKESGNQTADFTWSVVAALYSAQKKYGTRILGSTLYIGSNFQWHWVKLETLNDISINIYTNEKGIMPIWFRSKEK